MHITFRKCLVTVLPCLIFIASSFKQNAGTITGTIKDARSKKPISEAVITISSTAFKGQKFALTDSSGTYRIANLPAGSYTISFEMEGYEKYLRENVALQDGLSVAISHDLEKERKRNRKGM